MSFISGLKKQVSSNKAKVSGLGVMVIFMGLLGAFTLMKASADPVSTPDCDANSVLWCGATSPAAVSDKYDHGDTHNSEASIRNIYSCVGITAADIYGMGSDSVSGYVTKTGDVYAGKTLVATGAVTGGRQNPYGAASTYHNCNGTTFYSRTPSVSFGNPELSAMVVMKNGVFQFAILNSCGNPVTATPKKPAYAIQKQVRVAGTSAYSSDVTAMAGTTVQYQITVSSTGQVAADNINVHDKLPAGISYVANSLQQNGVSQPSLQQTQFFSNGVTIASLASGSKAVFTFNAVVGAGATYATCTPGVLNNEGYITSPVLPGQSSGATVTEQCPAPPKVTLTCNQLTLTPGATDTEGNIAYTLAASASATNATITGYTFSLGNGQTKTVTTSATTASVTNTYAPGTYSPSVSVTATANGKTYTESSQNCTGTITVPPLPQPVIACTELTLTAGTADAQGNTPYTLAAAGSATNATITGYTFTFGDNSQTKTITTGNTSATTTHTYAPGTYTPSVSVNAIANGKTYTVTSPKCAGSITIGTPPVAQYTCDELTLTPAGAADAEGNIAYSLAARASAKNATITGYTFTFGDSSQPQVITTGDMSAKASHTYAPGTYTAQVTVAVILADGSIKQVTSPKCIAQITVTPPPATCVSPTNGQKYPVGSPECQPAPTCTAPSGQVYPAGSTQCAPTPTPPSTPAATELVNTGPGSTIALFAGTVIVGFFGHKLILNRRSRRSSRSETTL